MEKPLLVNLTKLIPRQISTLVIKKIMPPFVKKILNILTK